MHAQIHIYDNGTATVISPFLLLRIQVWHFVFVCCGHFAAVFAKKAHGDKFVEEYNGVELDGKPPDFTSLWLAFHVALC